MVSLRKRLREPGKIGDRGIEAVHLQRVIGVATNMIEAVLLEIAFPPKRTPISVLFFYKFYGGFCMKWGAI